MRFFGVTVRMLECLLCELSEEDVSECGPEHSWRTRGKKRTPWAHLHEREAQAVPRITEMSRIYSVLFAWPHSDRFAIFMNIILHLPSRTRTSIFELTVHFELAELCLSVRVPSQGYAQAYMSISISMCLAILFPWSLRETLFQSAETSCASSMDHRPYNVFWCLKTWCLQVPIYPSLTCSAVLF